MTRQAINLTNQFIKLGWFFSKNTFIKNLEELEKQKSKRKYLKKWKSDSLKVIKFDTKALVSVIIKSIFWN